MINIDDFDLCIIFLPTLTYIPFLLLKYVVTIAYVHMGLNTTASKVSLFRHNNV